MTSGERRRSDCCAAAEEKQLCDKVMEDGGRRRAGVLIFSFLGGMNLTSNLTSTKDLNLGFLGGDLCYNLR